jgi:hypothetical protein
LSENNDAIRRTFEKFIQTMIGERQTDGIAEEAGDDREVWEYLKAQEAEIPKLVLHIDGNGVYRDLAR